METVTKVGIVAAVAILAIVLYKKFVGAAEKITSGEDDTPPEKPATPDGIEQIGPAGIPAPSPTSGRGGLAPVAKDETIKAADNYRVGKKYGDGNIKWYSPKTTFKVSEIEKEFKVYEVVKQQFPIPINARFAVTPIWRRGFGFIEKQKMSADGWQSATGFTY